MIEENRLRGSYRPDCGKRNAGIFSGGVHSAVIGRECHEVNSFLFEKVMIVDI
jgi:hypothetical protein